MINRSPLQPAFSCDHLPAGSRLGLAVSGGADSVALLRLAHRLAGPRGWTLQVLHLDHCLRGEHSRTDRSFVEQTAAELGLACTVEQVDVGLLARERQIGLEDAGRLVRSGWFARLLLGGELDAIATGHTLDDQAETVLAKLLRGAWTAGLAGIHPAVRASELTGAELTGTDRTGAAQRHKTSGVHKEGMLVRPLLAVRREELRSWLTTLGQPWREDITNQDPQFTRNRIRHELLPVLTSFFPSVAERLAQISELALAEEHYWQAELDRLLPKLLLPGRPVRGGGRSNTAGSSSAAGSQERCVALETTSLLTLHTALQRRVVRAVAAQLGESLDFAQTMRALALLYGSPGSTARREQLSGHLHVERSTRELRFVAVQNPRHSTDEMVSVPVPGAGEGFGVRLRLRYPGKEPQPPAFLRGPRPGDRVRLRYSGGSPKKIKEVLERMGVPPHERPVWPVLEWQGEVVWVRGAQLDLSARAALLTISEEQLPEGSSARV